MPPMLRESWLSGLLVCYCTLPVSCICPKHAKQWVSLAKSCCWQ